jgi:hypothetical protein
LKEAIPEQSFPTNRIWVGIAFKEVKGKLHPSVGLKKTGEHVRVNFGQTPFVYDIDGLAKASIHFVVFLLTVPHHSLNRFFFSFLPFSYTSLPSGLQSKPCICLEGVRQSPFHLLYQTSTSSNRLSIAMYEAMSLHYISAP